MPRNGNDSSAVRPDDVLALPANVKTGLPQGTHRKKMSDAGNLGNG